MLDLSQIEVFKDIPQNIVASIFLAGFVTGFLVTVVFLLLIKAGGEKREKAPETPHDIIMAIKQKAATEKVPLTFSGIIKFLLVAVLLFIGLFVLVAIGRYLTEGQPQGEAFVPFVIRIFIFPLMERFPALQNL